MSEQEYTASGKSGYVVGDHIHGFSYGLGKEYKEKIKEVKPYLVFGYVLESGVELGPHDDIYGLCDSLEQQETLAYLKQALDEDRLSDRPLFPKGSER